MSILGNATSQMVSFSSKCAKMCHFKKKNTQKTSNHWGEPAENFPYTLVLLYNLLLIAN